MKEYLENLKEKLNEMSKELDEITDYITENVSTLNPEKSYLLKGLYQAISGLELAADECVEVAECEDED